MSFKTEEGVLVTELRGVRLAVKFEWWLMRAGASPSPMLDAAVLGVAAGGIGGVEILPLIDDDAEDALRDACIEAVRVTNGVRDERDRELEP